LQPAISPMGPYFAPPWGTGKSLLTVALVLVGLASASAQAEDVIGQAFVIDGDTLEIHGTRIRLFGIDAPESTQLCRGSDSDTYRCGAKAANDLAALINRRPVSCASLV
jgi:endonuclease YncB( thermonuclease family)